jgi:hypothetical protein
MIGRRILAVPSDSSNWPGQLSCGFASFRGHHWACPRTRSTLLAQMALVMAYGVRRSLLRHLPCLLATREATCAISTSYRGNFPHLNVLPWACHWARRGRSSQRGCPPAGFPRGLPTLHVKARLQRPGMAPLALAWLPAGYPSEPLAPLAPRPKRQTSCKAPLSAPARCTLARPQPCPRSFNGGLIVAGIIGLSLPHLRRSSAGPHPPIQPKGSTTLNPLFP